MFITKFISAELDSVGRRIAKVLRFGKHDTQTGFQSTPYGIDSNPIKGMRAIYSTTAQKGKTVIVGYINVDQLADPGELRLFSTDTNGELKFSIWLKADGTCEVGGNSDNLVRYIPLDQGLQNFKTEIQQELVKIATGIASAGGSYTPGTLSVDISASKIDEIKSL